MSRSPTKRVIPATAEELYGMHPGVSATRQRNGTFEIGPFRDKPSPYAEFFATVGLAKRKGEEQADSLFINGYLLSGDMDTHVSVPYPVGTIDAPSSVIRGSLRTELVIGLATAGIELLDGYAGLSEAERYRWPHMPYANEKVFDHLGHPALRSFAPFVAARGLLLLDLPEQP